MSILLQICRPCKVSALGLSVNGASTRIEFSSGDDFLEESIDLNHEVAKNNQATFYARIIGETEKSEFSDGDLLVVDRSLPLQHDKMVVCFLEGNFTVKKVRREEGTLWLETLNRPYDAIRLTGDNYYMVWGLVTYIVKRTW